jgi:hypothetical protein
MFLTASTATINLSTGVIAQSDPVSARKTLALTLTNVGDKNVDNIRAALYRLNRNGVDGTLVATCNTFTLSGTSFVGSMNLNTTEVVTAYTNLVSPRQYETLRFDLLVWDASDNVYIIWDGLNVAFEVAVTDGSTNVSPIDTSTVIWGTLKLSDGVIYLFNPDTGLYNKLTAKGANEVQHLELGEGEAI